MKSFKPVLGAVVVGLCTYGFTASAQTAGTQTAPAANPETSTGTPTNRPADRMARPGGNGDAVANTYKADKERCDALSGNAEDVCNKEAEAKRDMAEANQKQAKKNAEANREATEDKNEAQYEVAKERCDALSGDAKDTCITNAKTKFNK